MEKLPSSKGLLNWGELNSWLWEYGYPVRVRVFEDSTLVSSPILLKPEEVSKLEKFSANGAKFYVLRPSPAELGYSPRAK